MQSPSPNDRRLRAEGGPADGGCVLSPHHRCEVIIRGPPIRDAIPPSLGPELDLIRSDRLTLLGIHVRGLGTREIVDTAGDSVRHEGVREISCWVTHDKLGCSVPM